MSIAIVGTAHNSNYDGSPVTTFSITDDHTTGNHLTVHIRYVGTVVSVTDTAGNTYALDATATTGDGTKMDSWSAENITGNASNTVLVTFVAGALYTGLLVVERSGVKLSGALDATATGTGSGGSVASGAFTTDTADEVIVAFQQVSALGGTWTPDTGFTNEVQDASAVAMCSDKVVSSTQTGITVTATSSSGSPMGIIVTTYRAASGGGGGVFNPYFYQFVGGLR